ncbi:hypothetical protein SDJN02_21486, partial [Cucurbita argyrosperma subsp. argyrosperma]
MVRTTRAPRAEGNGTLKKSRDQRLTASSLPLSLKGEVMEAFLCNFDVQKLEDIVTAIEYVTMICTQLKKVAAHLKIYYPEQLRKIRNPPNHFIVSEIQYSNIATVDQLVGKLPRNVV